MYCLNLITYSEKGQPYFKIRIIKLKSSLILNIHFDFFLEINMTVYFSFKDE